MGDSQTNCESTDDLFEKACFVLRESLALPNAFTDDEVTTAAETAMRFALDNGGRFGLQKVLSLYSLYVERGVVCPRPILTGLAQVFRTFENGCTMDEAFGLNRLTGGRPPAEYQQRNRARCNAIAVCFWMEKLGTSSLRSAANKWAEIQALDSSMKVDSVQTIERDYKKHSETAWLNATRERYKKTFGRYSQ